MFSLNRNKFSDIMYESVDEVKNTFQKASKAHLQTLHLFELECNFEGFVKARRFKKTDPKFIAVIKQDQFEIKPESGHL